MHSIYRYYLDLICDRDRASDGHSIQRNFRIGSRNPTKRSAADQDKQLETLN